MAGLDQKTRGSCGRSQNSASKHGIRGGSWAERGRFTTSGASRGKHVVWTTAWVAGADRFADLATIDVLPPPIPVLTEPLTSARRPRPQVRRKTNSAPDVERLGPRARHHVRAAALQPAEHLHRA